MLTEFIMLVFAFIFSYILIFAITPIAVRFGLVDKPCMRKQHDGAIPLIGGVSIFLAVAISVMVFYPLTVQVISYLICAGAIVLLGVVDDYKQLGIKVRLLIQVLVALVMIYGSNVYIHNLGDLFLIGNIDLGWFGIVFTIISVIACINAFNMIDGIDGLAGSLSILTLLSVFILMFLSGNYVFVYLPLIIVATVVPYLAFNLGIKGHRNKKIFMGDAGSMFIGLSVIWFLMVSTQSNEAAFRPVTALWIIAVPLMDMMAVIIRRKRKGLSPFHADRDHLHHIFMRFGFSPRKSLASILFFAIIMSSVGIAGEVLNISEWIMLVLFLIVFVFYSLALQHCWKVARFLRRKKE